MNRDYHFLSSNTSTPTKRRRVEDELLISVARKSLEKCLVARLRELNRQNIDWEYLLHAASLHGLLPLLSKHLLTAARDLLPQPILEQLKTESFEGSKDSIYLVRELLRVLRLFNAANIHALVFKGPVLSRMVYDDVGLRQPGDLDILIAKEDFSRVKDLLQSNSYLMDPQLSPAQQRSHLRSHCEIPFCHKDQFSVVDLHWGLTPKSFPFFVSFEELWTRRQTIRLAGQPVETFSKEDLVLYLCVHAAKHYWNRLEWIASIAELTRSSDVDWSKVVHLSRTTNSQKILKLGLMLASNLFRLELPREPNELLKGSEELQKVALTLEEKLFVNTGKPATQVEMFRWNLKFLDRRRDAIQGFLRSIFLPTISDWQKIRLPDALYPLYFGTRPFLLLRKYGKQRTSANAVNDWTKP